MKKLMLVASIVLVVGLLFLHDILGDAMTTLREYLVQVPRDLWFWLALATTVAVVPGIIAWGAYGARTKS